MRTRNTLRRSLRNLPRCANCHATCPDDNQSFVDPIHIADHDISNFETTDMKLDSEPSIEDNEDVSIEKESSLHDQDESSNRRNKKKARLKLITIFDVLLKFFKNEWQREKELLISTRKHKDTLILCRQCSRCLWCIYDWYSKFLDLTLTSGKESYLYPVVCPIKSPKHEDEDKTQMVVEVSPEFVPDVETKVSRHESTREVSETTKSRKQRKHKQKSKTSFQPNEFEDGQENPVSHSIKEEVEYFPHLPVEVNKIQAEYCELACKICGVKFVNDEMLHKHVSSLAHRRMKQKQMETVSDSTKTEPPPKVDANHEEFKSVRHKQRLSQLASDATSRRKRSKFSKEVLPDKEPSLIRATKKNLIIRFFCSDPGCEFEVDDKEKYLTHLADVHDKTDNVEFIAGGKSGTPFCIICNSAFDTQEDLWSHLSTKHIPNVKVRSYECPECGKAFITRKDQKNHSERHSISFRYDCDQCEFSSRRPQEVRRHKKLVHERVKNFRCELCGKDYVLKWQLTNHLLTHAEQKLFTCKDMTCRKSFRTAGNLRQHMEMHQGNRFYCDYCGSSFSRKAYLRLHINGVHLNLPLPPSSLVSDTSVPKRRSRNRKVPEDFETEIVGLPQPPESETDDIPSGAVTRSIRKPRKRKTTQATAADFAGILDLTLSESNDGITVKEAIDNPNEEEEEMILLKYPEELQDLEVDDGGRKTPILVRMDLESGDVEQIARINPSTTTTMTLAPEPPQIICFEGLEMVPQYPLTISTEAGNTFYITTGPNDQSGGQVFHPFTDFS